MGKGKTITGEERIKLELDINEVTALIAGCRDLAAWAEKRREAAIARGDDPLDIQLEEDLHNHNNHLADMLEREMLSQLGE